MMNAFCASVNFDAFICFRSSPSQEIVAENFSFKRSSLRGSDHSVSTKFLWLLTVPSSQFGCYAPTFPVNYSKGYRFTRVKVSQASCPYDLDMDEHILRRSK